MPALVRMLNIGLNSRVTGLEARHTVIDLNANAGPQVMAGQVRTACQLRRSGIKREREKKNPAYPNHSNKRAGSPRRNSPEKARYFTQS